MSKIGGKTTRFQEQMTKNLNNPRKRTMCYRNLQKS